MRWRTVARLLPGLGAVAVLFVAGGSSGLAAPAPDTCASEPNPIVCENARPGNPSSEWDVAGMGDPSIQGFATDFSVNDGDEVAFKIKTDALDYRIDIYRMGYYGGAGARKVATVAPSASLPQLQPSCLTDTSTGLVDCGNWAESARWQVPPGAVSGIYFARLVRTDTGGDSHIFFVVRDDDGASDVLFQTSDTTWQAYNRYGGNSLYVGGPAGRAYKVSYNRPFTTREYASPSFVWEDEYPMVRWLERNGYDVSYFSGIDTARSGPELLEHRAFLSVGHDEYWSG
ncbi:MAG TPA: N,N-dimethylformamidase beta subunit family domain-containing protein, partial [Gaiellaceae bacterium]|nr:N,N-dimethylformamidase beta subunit family domain-containing protein [Gaiellaceae bacterium]